MGTLNQTIGFIGAGQMARALAQGFVRAGLLADRQLMAADPSSEALAEFKRLLPGSTAASSNTDLAHACEIIFLAVKPQQAKAAMADLHAALGSGKMEGKHKLVISIVTGIRLQTLANGVGTARLVRV